MKNLYTTHDDLEGAVGADVDLSEPDAVATWMRANLDNLPDHHALCAHEVKPYLLAASLGGILGRALQDF